MRRADFDLATSVRLEGVVSTLAATHQRVLDWLAFGWLRRQRPKKAMTRTHNSWFLERATVLRVRSTTANNVSGPHSRSEKAARVATLRAVGCKGLAEKERTTFLPFPLTVCAVCFATTG